MNKIEQNKLDDENKTAKELIREYISLSLQEDKDIEANIKLFQSAEAFLQEQDK